MAPICWLIDLHPDFPASQTVAEYLETRYQRPPILITRHEAMMGRWPDTEDWLVGYGTMSTMNHVLRSPHLNTAVFDDYRNLRCSKYYAYLHPFLNRTFFLAPFGALPHLPLQHMLGEQVFIRPDSNYKLFPSEVLNVGDIEQWIKTYHLYQNELAVIAEVVHFEQEYRCFCRNGQFFCGSSYPTEPYTEVPLEVQHFAEQAARMLELTGMNMLTIDVGLTHGELSIVEVGGVNSWGIYGADIDAFITAMEAEAHQRWNDLY